MATKAHPYEWNGRPRRRVPRFELQAPLDVTAKRTEAAESIPGRTVNISERGIEAVMAGELIEGETVSVDLMLPDDADPLRLQAIVRHTGELSCGLEFRRLSAEQREKVRHYTKEAEGIADQKISDLMPSLKTRDQNGVENRGASRAEESVEEESSAWGGMESYWPTRRAWILIAIAAVIIGMLAWWRWNLGWEQLESGLRNQNAAIEKPEIRLPAEDMERLLIHRVEPIYPAEAREKNLQAIVALDLIVGRDGSVLSVRPLNGPDILARAAADALRWWKFQPYRENGRPMVVETTMAVEFKP